jgi:hemerythrin superfamily protein
MIHPNRRIAKSNTQENPMSVIDKVIDAVTPAESEEDRADVRAKARAMASPGDWFSLILDHHIEIEKAFAATKAAAAGSARMTAMKKLAGVLMGHSIAEEAVVYPSMGDAGEKGHATTGYDEQVAVKMQMAELEKIDPASQEFLDKAETIRSAVAHHMYEEEGDWYPELKQKAPAEDQAMITKRYEEEFKRYVGADA